LNKEFLTSVIKLKLTTKERQMSSEISKNSKNGSGCPVMHGGTDKIKSDTNSRMVAKKFKS
jgi:hypothetical protein